MNTIKICMSIENGFFTFNCQRPKIMKFTKHFIVMHGPVSVFMRSDVESLFSKCIEAIFIFLKKFMTNCGPYYNIKIHQSSRALCFYTLMCC